MRGQAFAFTSYRLGLCAYIDGGGDDDGGWLVASATVFVHHM